LPVARDRADPGDAVSPHPGKEPRVGYYRSLPRNYTLVFATYLTWIFYAPALVLTALSSDDLDRVF
jgi:hypothetical protein